MKKILSVALVISMFALLLSGCGGANFTAMTEDIYQFDVVKGKAVITDVDTSAAGDLIVPSTLCGYPVDAVGDNAFEGCTAVISINLPEGVTSIGDSAFAGCTALDGVRVPDGVTSIGAKAFSGCRRLYILLLPDSVTSIGEACFENCTTLIKMTIPAKVKTIEANTFNACTSLEKVYFTEKLKSVESSAFEDCSALKEVFYSSSESKKGKISIAGGNEKLVSAAWHYDAEF